MSTPRRSPTPLAAWARRGCGVLAAGVLVTGALAPAAAQALTLAQLLELPFERLLELRIGGRR